MEIKKNVFLSFIVAGKLLPGDYDELKEANSVPPRFGRNWWFWKPDFTKTNIGWSLVWLCFMITYDNHNNIDHSNDGRTQQYEIKDI